MLFASSFTTYTRIFLYQAHIYTLSLLFPFLSLYFPFASILISGSINLMSPFLVFLLILLSMHACNARILKETKKNDFHTKDVEKVNLDQISIPSRTLRREEVGNMDESSVGANSIMNRNNLQPFLKEKEAILGDELIVTWQKNLLHTTEILQGLKKQERSLLRSSATSDTKEAVESNENDVTGDVEVMDYAQPHRKPPIHNEKS